MKTRQRGKTAPRYTGLGRCILSLAICTALGASAADTQLSQPKIVGAWRLTVHHVDCVSGQATDDPFQVLGSFFADGNVQEVPYGNQTIRTPGHGSWKKTGWRKFVSSAEFGLLDPNGLNFAYAVVDRMFDVAKDGQTATIRGRTRLFTLNDDLVQVSCIAASARRLPAPEPF